MESVKSETGRRSSYHKNNRNPRKDKPPSTPPTIPPTARLELGSCGSVDPKVEVKDGDALEDVVGDTLEDVVGDSSAV